MSISMLNPCLSGPNPSLPAFTSHRIQLKRTVWLCSASQSHVAVVNVPVLDGKVPERSEIRLGLPSKGRMASDTLDLLKVKSFLCLVPEKISMNFE
jgi:ATP phosphoribosyltransferase